MSTEGLQLPSTPGPGACRRASAVAGLCLLTLPRALPLLPALLSMKDNYLFLKEVKNLVEKTNCELKVCFQYMNRGDRWVQVRPPGREGTAQDSAEAAEGLHPGGSCSARATPARPRVRAHWDIDAPGGPLQPLRGADGWSSRDVRPWGGATAWPAASLWSAPQQPGRSQSEYSTALRFRRSSQGGVRRMLPVFKAGSV